MLKVSGLRSEHSDQVSKLLKYVADVSRKIEEKHQSAEKVEDVFSLDLLNLRIRLKELATKMLSLDPGKSGVKVLDHHWKKCFHEPYSVARQLRGSGWSKRQVALIQSHLLSGIGTYQNFILYLTEKFGWESDFPLDFAVVRSYGFGCASFSGVKKAPDPLTEDGVDQSWVEAVVLRCLVWLGDLARYLETDLSSSSPVSASRYYQLATFLGPNLGQPFNNLAMLAGDKNHGLDQLYLYLKCLCCKTATENGQVNLKRLLDKQVVFGGEGQSLVSGLVQLVKMVMEGEHQDQVTVGCQHSLAYLHTALEAEQLPDLAASNWLGLAVSVVILLVQHKQEPVCQAWLMAILSHLAGKIVANVLDKFPELEAKEIEEINEDPKEIKEDVKKRKNKLENMLRRRRAGQSGSEGDDSDKSSDEIFESDEESDEEEEDDDNSDDDFLIESSSEEDDDDDDDVVVEDRQPPTQAEVVATCHEKELLATFSLCQTWLRQHPHLLAQTGQGSEQMWTNLANLFTVLCLDPRDGLTLSPEVATTLDRYNSAEKNPPLPEDWLIRGHSVEADGKLAWSQHLATKPEENILRLVRVAEFRDWLCGHPDSKITWDAERKMARCRKAVAETDKKNVMTKMTELWLRQEVKDLEKEATKDGGVVVVDCPALVCNLGMVKRTLGLKKFTLVVPTVAVQQLDNLKKNERGAREAIRWLERELARGNKWLRAQKQGETSGLEEVEVASTATKHQVQLLQCLAFLVARCQDADTVTLLTGDQDLLNGDAEFLAALGTSVTVENVDGFVPRVLGGADKNAGRARKRPAKGKRRRDQENIG